MAPVEYLADPADVIIMPVGSHNQCDCVLDVYTECIKVLQRRRHAQVRMKAGIYKDPFTTPKVNCDRFPIPWTEQGNF